MIPGTSLRASQVLAFVLVVAAVILWVVKSVQLKKTGKTQLYVDTEEGQLVVSGQFYQKKNKEQPKVEENFPGNGEPADALSETEEIARYREVRRNPVWQQSWMERHFLSSSRSR